MASDLAYSTQAGKLISDEIRTRENILSSLTQRKTALPLRVLEEISRVVPKDVLVDVTNYSYQGNTVDIKAETDSFSNSEKLLELLKSVPSFQSVERKSQENKPGSEGKIVTFSVTAVLKEGG